MFLVALDGEIGPGHDVSTAEFVEFFVAATRLLRNCVRDYHNHRSEREPLTISTKCALDRSGIGHCATTVNEKKEWKGGGSRSLATVDVM
jgi:hypothetical protein